MKEQQDHTFPSHSTFHRLGPKATVLQRVCHYAQERGWEDVVKLCTTTSPVEPSTPPQDSVMVGCVYLAKAGKYYKIGRTNAMGRREYELAIQLPQKMKMPHQFKTDDPAGIESYWHAHFASKRQNGEWFALTPDDIGAFRRRKFM